MIYTLIDYVFSQSERGQLLDYITMPELAKHIYISHMSIAKF